MLTYIDYDIKMLYTICTSIVYLKKFLKIDLVTIITPTTKVLYRSPTSRTPPEYCHITTTKKKGFRIRVMTHASQRLIYALGAILLV